MPTLLGFEPHDCVVLAVLSDDDVIAAARVDLGQPITERNALEMLSGVAQTQPERSIALVFYSQDRELVVEASHELQAACEMDEWGVLDALLVSGSRWWSLLCDDSECCPPDGQVVEVISDPLFGELVALGDSPYVARQILVDSLQSEDLDYAGQAARQSAYNLRFDELSLALNASQTFVRDEWVTRAFSLMCTDVQLEWDDIAVIAIVIDDIRMRDGLLRRCFDDSASRAATLENLRFALRRVASSHIAGISTVLAGIAWLDGNTLLTQIALDRALEEDPSYSLAHLLQLALTHNVPPSVWSDSLEAVSYDQCLLGAA